MKKLLTFCGVVLLSSTLLAKDSSNIGIHFGELPPAEKIQTIVSAGNPSDVVLLAVAPDKLAGFAGFKMQSAKGKLFPEALQKLPTLGKVSGKSSTLSPEKLLALKADLIVDIGNVSPNYIDQARKTQAQTNVPYVLLDGELSRTPELLRELGKITGKSTEALAQYAEQTLQQAVISAQNFAKTAYLARGTTGLETGLVGSIHTQAMELVGLKNVATGEHKGLAQVSMEQVLQWNPALIFTQYPEFYQGVWTNPQWQNVAAVKNKQVYLVPHTPFGWLDSPPSLNRLLGIRWLQHLLSGKSEAEFVPEIQQFYKLFYQIDLSAEQALQLFQPPMK